MDGTFVAQLREIRANLRDSVRAVEILENKFVGPRPCDPANSAKQGSESMATLLSEVMSLSAQLPKMIAHQHEIVGEFVPSAEGMAGTQAPRYA